MLCKATITNYNKQDYKDRQGRTDSYLEAT
jgi:hypothetical protein